MFIHLNDQLLVWEASSNCSVVEAMIPQFFAQTWVPAVILKSAEHPVLTGEHVAEAHALQHFLSHQICSFVTCFLFSPFPTIPS